MSDVFISFVSQDQSLAQELADKLQQKNISAELIRLGLGDSLIGRIEQGFRNAEYGVLILSPAFFRKPWPRNELEKVATFDQAYDGRTLLLPLWHNITQQDIARYAPALAGRLGGSTDQGLDVIANEIQEVVQPDQIDISQTNTYKSVPLQKMVSSEMSESASNISDPRALNDALNNYFSMGELADLAWDMDIDFEEIPGDTKSAKARELIAYCQRRGRLDDLVHSVQVRRPFIS